MSVLRRLLHRASAWTPGLDEGFWAITYHLVGAGTGSPVDLDVSDFEVQIETMRSVALSLTGGVNHVLDRARGTRVVCTFDDAFENFFRVAWPILQRHEVPCVLYVPTGFVDGTGPGPLRGAERLAACSWGQLRELVESGLVTIGSHTVTHRSLTRLGEVDLRRELAVSRARLEDQLGRPVQDFCYPRGEISSLATKMVRREYATAVIRGGRKVTGSSFDPWGLQRIPVRREFGCHLPFLSGGSVWYEEWIADKAAMIRRRFN